MSATEPVSGGLHFILAYLLPPFVCVGLVGNALVLITLNVSSSKQSKKTSLFLSAKAVADFGVGIFAILFNLNMYNRMADSDAYDRFYYHELLKPAFAIMNWLLLTSTW